MSEHVLPFRSRRTAGTQRKPSGIRREYGSRNPWQLVELRRPFSHVPRRCPYAAVSYSADSDTFWEMAMINWKPKRRSPRIDNHAAR